MTLAVGLGWETHHLGGSIAGSLLFVLESHVRRAVVLLFFVEVQACCPALIVVRE